MDTTNQLNEKTLDSDSLVELDISELACVAGGMGGGSKGVPTQNDCLA